MPRIVMFYRPDPDGFDRGLRGQRRPIVGLLPEQVWPCDKCSGQGEYLAGPRGNEDTVGCRECGTSGIGHSSRMSGAVLPWRGVMDVGGSSRDRRLALDCCVRLVNHLPDGVTVLLGLPYEVSSSALRDVAAKIKAAREADAAAGGDVSSRYGFDADAWLESAIDTVCSAAEESGEEAGEAVVTICLDVH